jgi:hypothetical protein
MQAMLDDDVAYLLADFGRNLTLTRQASGTYDPATGMMAATTPTTQTIRGVFINYRDTNVDGTVIRMGDRLLLVQAKAATTAPAIGDRVDGLQIVDVRTIAPNGIPVAWSCQTRK